MATGGKWGKYRYSETDKVEGTGVLPQMMDESKWIKQRLSKWMIVLKELKINWYT